MKILFLYDFPLWGSGSGSFLRNLAQELIKLNHKIGIVAPEKKRFLEDKIKQYQVALPQIPVFLGHPELKTAKRYSELTDNEITDIYKAYLNTTLDAIDNFGPDIIHVQHLSLISWVARYVSALKNVKYIITSHGSCLHNLLTDKKYLPLCKDAVREASAISVVSGDTRIKFLEIFGKEYNKNIRVIPGGIDMNLYPSKPDTSLIEKKYNLKDKKVVLFSGRLISHKGARYLIKAAKNINGEVILAGDGPEKQYLLSLISKHRLKNVHLIGYVSGQDLIELYSRADVFVAPSVWDEPLGLVILEAMAAKTPVVASRKGGIPLLVKDGYNGFFVKTRNSKEIAAACNKVLENEELRLKLGENARKTIEEKFSWKKTASKFHNLYKRIYRNKNHKK